MKKTVSLLLAMALLIGALAGCSKRPASDVTETDKTATFKIAGMTGPTTIGMVKLMDTAEENRLDEEYRGNVYDVSVYGTAQEITPLLIQGQLDVAAVPANLAATLYRKTEGEIQVAAVNTLGVLYVVQKGETVKTIEDLKGQTIYTTGKGTTPEYTLRHVLAENGIDPDNDVTIEFLSEATEVGARIAAADGDIIAMLPQPYVTAVTTQNPDVTVALDMTEEWAKVSDNNLVTGVLVVRKSFAEENKEAFGTFLADYKASTEYVNANVDDAAGLVVKYGIIAREPIAKKAIPRCNITYADGEGMKAMLESYLSVLFRQNPESVGGAMPDEAFYYMG